MMSVARDRTSLTCAGALTLVLVATVLAGCASRSYRPTPPGETTLFERVQSETKHGVTARVAVASAEESERIFGLPLYDRGIQPVWLEIENSTDARLRFAPVGTDRTYFPPHEVAYMHKGRYRGDGYRDMERWLYEQSISRWIWPGETRSGWLFTHAAPGTKALNVDLFETAGGSIRFHFFVEVPGLTPDHAAVDFDHLYDEADVMRVDEAGLREALDALGCCTTDRTGEREGPPINVVMIGAGDDVLKALLRAHFYERPRAERPEDAGREPHFDGRPADALLRTRRTGLGDSNQLRVWRTPMFASGKPVWVGSISHYIGQPTEIGRALFDARVDPNMDVGRDFILQATWYTQSLARMAWQNAGPAIDDEAPATDFRGIKWFGSGDRVVLWLSGEPISQGETVTLDWDEPPGSEAP